MQPSLSMTPQERGAAAETQVLRMLIGRGWQLLDRNWRCRWGELDLLLIKGRCLLLVEVKGRCSPARGRPMVRPAQRCRLGRAIDCWRSLHPDQADCLLQVAVALVPLPPSRGRVRWFLLERLC